MPSGNHFLNINLNSFPSGIYNVNILSSKNQTTKKLIVID